MPSQDIYQLKVSLVEIEPVIWRRLQVRGTVTLSRLHAILQDVMGWTNSHLYAFRIADQIYEEPHPEAHGANARKAQLGRLGLKTGDAFEYQYDIGDDWRHRVVVEEVSRPIAGRAYPICLDGARACPPEDCGGLPGLALILEAIEHPADPEFREILDSLDGAFDPEVFDLRATNRILGLAHRKGAV